MYFVQFYGFDVLQHAFPIPTDGDVVDGEHIVGRDVLAVGGYEFRTNLQHVEQRHLRVRLQRICVNGVMVAMILHDLLRTKLPHAHRPNEHHTEQVSCYRS